MTEPEQGRAAGVVTGRRSSVAETRAVAAPTGGCYDDVVTTYEARIPFDPAALRELGGSPAEIEAQMRLLLAATLFQKGQLSIGKAAEMAGMSRIPFMFKLGEMRIPVINLTGDELVHELSFGRR